MNVSDISPKEYNAYYKPYIDRVAEGKLLKLLYDNQNNTARFFNTIPEDKLTYRYAEGKWSILEVFQHLIDNERIFAYRAFRFGRKDNTPLEGYEQDDYSSPSLADEKSVEQLLKEYKVTRMNTLIILQSLSDDALAFIGSASGSPMSARAAAAIIIGHETHHIEIIKKRYL